MSTTRTDNPIILIDNEMQLMDICQDLAQQLVLAVDTEFARSRTFYPMLGLIQISDGEAVYLLDPLRIDNLQPFFKLLLNPRITKVFHACSEDLEVLFHSGKVLPVPLFDTQVAGAFLGLGTSIGYSKLVQQYLNISLDKNETRTDWLQRPLSDEQIEYAADDVRFLYQVYHHLKEELEAKSLLRWVEEDCLELLDPGRFDNDPDEMYSKIKKAHQLDRKTLAILRELAAWRELEARKRNLPRNFVMHSDVLLNIATRHPTSLTELSLIRGMGDRDIFYYGEFLLKLINKALNMSPETYPQQIIRTIDIPNIKEASKAIKSIVAQTAQELGIDPIVLANNRFIERHLKALAGLRSYTPLIGWRKRVLHDKIRPIEETFLAAQKTNDNDD